MKLQIVFYKNKHFRKMVGGLEIRRVSILGLVILLLLTSINHLQVAAPDLIQLTEHSPISINGNGKLQNVAESEGWLGTGTEESPIVISNLNISSESYGIKISNVDLCLRIENCYISKVEMSTHSRFGILLENCTRASVQDCVIVEHEFGICLTNSDGAVVNRTEIYDSFFGVFANWSSHVWLHSLDIVMCKIGVRLNHTVHAYVDQTIIDHCEYAGIEGICDSGTLLRHNSIIGSEVGITWAANTDWVIEESMIWSCENGLVAYHTNGGFLIESWIKDCSILGIVLGSLSYNISITGNLFGPNNTQNALDDGEANWWYDEYSQLGNYWSDYSGDGPYTIPGSAGSVDLYAASLEEAPNWEDETTAETTNATDNPFSDQILMIAVVAAIVILLASMAMFRSRVT